MLEQNQSFYKRHFIDITFKPRQEHFTSQLHNFNQLFVISKHIFHQTFRRCSTTGDRHQHILEPARISGNKLWFV